MYTYSLQYLTIKALFKGVSFSVDFYIALGRCTYIDCAGVYLTDKWPLRQASVEPT